MRTEIMALEAEARAVGEAFLTVRASRGLRLGVAARWDDGALSVSLEVQVRLLPAHSDVHIEALRARVEDLAYLEAGGFGLFHFEDGWVLATRPTSPDEVDGAVGSVNHLFAEEDRYPGRA